MSRARMLSPTAGPTSSRTSPSERKWLPRTSSRPTRRRSLAKTRCHAVQAPATARSADRRDLQPRGAARVAKPRRRGRTRVRRRGRRNGDSSTAGSSGSSRSSSGGGPTGSPRRVTRALRRSSSSPAVHTLPAPSVSTTSPSRTSATSRSVGRPQVPRPRHLPVAALGDGPRERLRRDPGDRLLGGGVDVGQQEHVGLVEGLAEVVPQRLRAREAVRLEEHHRAPRARAAAQRLERRRGSRSGGGRSRRSPGRRPPRPAPGSAGRRR